MSLRITHGRHCACGACARQDWAEPGLAPCGMHGSSCPPRYDPRGVAGDLIGEGDLIEASTRDLVLHIIASELDKPSVYMGGPSPRSRRTAAKIVERLEANGLLRQGDGDE